MKAAEFYERAANDAAFRRAKIDDLRYYRLVGRGLAWFCGVFGVAIWLYGGLQADRWDDGGAMFCIVLLTANACATCSAQLAALEALEKHVDRAPAPS